MQVGKVKKRTIVKKRQVGNRKVAIKIYINN